MQCACGFQQKTGRPNIDAKAMNQHCRTCAAYWEAVYEEMRRIALEQFGGLVPVSRQMWNEFRSGDFPTSDAMVKWEPVVKWPEVQAAAGLGVLKRGKGSLAQRGLEVLGVADSNARLDAIALSIRPLTTTVETYMAQTSREGLTICERTYLKTGRMWVR